MSRFRKTTDSGEVGVMEQINAANTPSLYPLEPGHQNTDTSRQAAEDVKGKAERLRRACLLAVRSAPKHDAGVLREGAKPVVKTTPTTNAAGRPVGVTVREACAALGEDNDNLNPRFSELRAAGLIRDSGVRRRNLHSGKNAIAWTPGDDPDKPRVKDNGPPAKPMLRAAYLRGMAAALHAVRDRSEDSSFLTAYQTIRARLAQLEPGNPEWRPEE